MSSMITNIASPEVSGEPDPGHRPELQGAFAGPGILPGPDWQVSPNNPAPHHMVVSERDRDRDARQVAPSQPPEGHIQGCAGRVARDARRHLNPPILWEPDLPFTPQVAEPPATAPYDRSPLAWTARTGVAIGGPMWRPPAAQAQADAMMMCPRLVAPLYRAAAAALSVPSTGCGFCPR